MKQLRILMILFAVLVGTPLAIWAEPLSEGEAVEAARDSLDGRIDFPWYDAESDGLRRVDVAPPPDLKNRNSKWEAKPATKPQQQNWQMPDWLWTMLEVFGWSILLVVLAAVGYLLVRAFLAAESGGAPGAAVLEDAAGVGHADRVESLPFQLKRPQANLLAEARKHYEAGNYAEAVIYLYSYQLVELDKHQFIRLAKGKTNRQYLREVRRQQNLFDLLRSTMLAFEDVFFGNHVLQRRRFEACWSRLDDFHQTMKQATP